MTFGNNEIDLNEGKRVSSKIEPGIKEVTITGFKIKTSSNGKKQVFFNVETRPIENKNFKPFDSAKFGGQVGDVNFTGIFINFDDNDVVKSFEKNIHILGLKTNNLDKIKQIKNVPTLEEYLHKVVSALENSYFWLAITGEEYEKRDNDGSISKYPGVKLGIRKFNFAASLEEGETHLKPFDKSNKYDYKELPKKTEVSDMISTQSPY